jgi:hypothetical protein
MAMCLVAIDASALETPSTPAGQEQPAISLWQVSPSGLDPARRPGSALDQVMITAQTPACVNVINVCKTFNPDLKCNRDNLKKYFRSGSSWCKTDQACTC